jgi:hypothetical protein
LRGPDLIWSNGSGTDSGFRLLSPFSAPGIRIAEAISTALEAGIRSGKLHAELDFITHSRQSIVPVRDRSEVTDGQIPGYQRRTAYDRRVGHADIRYFEEEPKNERPGPQGLVASFVASDSFAETRSRLGLLFKAKYWDKTLSERCLTAMEKNGQISGTTGARSHLADILKEHEAKCE